MIDAGPVGTLPPPFPGRWEQAWVRGGAQGWRLRTDAGGVRHAKHGPLDGVDGLTGEVARLRWAAGRAPVPSVVVAPGDTGSGAAATTGWLLTDAPPGVPADDPQHRMGSVEALLAALGAGLRRLHDTLPVDRCPFSAGLGTTLGRADQRLAEGDIDPDRLRGAYRHRTAAQLVDHLHATVPTEPEPDRVVAHGDPCLSNLLVDPRSGLLSGVVGLGRLGVSDRYRDLAVVVRSLVDDLGPEVVWRFLDAYGVPHPDPARLEFYVLLDDLA